MITKTNKQLMKLKKTILLLVALMTVGTAQTAMAQQRKTVAKQTVKKPAATAQTVINVNFQGELGLYELRGPVKVCKVIESWGGGDTYYFNRDGFKTDEKGKLLATNPEERMTYTRDSKGRLASIKDDNMDTYETYAYNANGLLSKYYWERFERKLTRTFTYNSEGELTKRVWKETGGQQDGTLITTYTILKRDSYGNWTERREKSKYTNEVVKREISYYESAAMPASTTQSGTSAASAATASTATAAPAETTCPLEGNWYGVLGNGWGETTVFLQADKKAGVNSKMANRLSNGAIDMTDDAFVREWNYNLVFNRTISPSTYEFTLQRMVGKQLKQGKLQIRKSGDNITFTGLDAWAKQQPFHGKTLGKPNAVYQ